MREKLDAERSDKASDNFTGTLKIVSGCCEI